MLMLEKIRYIYKYIALNVICTLIPHPKLRALYLKMLGAEIGSRVRIEDVRFIQLYYPLRHLTCEDDVFIGTGVTIDLSSPIFIGKSSVIGPGCSLITHQDMGHFNKNALSEIYPKIFSAITVKENVFIGCDSTVLPGATIESYTVIGAKSLITGNVPGGVLAAGIPGKIIKALRKADT